MTSDRPPRRPGRRPWVPGERLARRTSGHDEEPALPADAPRVGVLALQGDVLEHLRVLGRVGAHATRVRRPAHLDGLDGLVVPGGESTTIGKMLVLTEMLDPLRGLVADGMPVFGTCAGMILLADELEQDFEQPLVGGLGVRVRRNAFGRQVDSFDAAVDVAGLDDGPIDASFIRAPWVAAVLADDVEVLGVVRDHPVVVRRGPLLASAFHPEVTGDDRLHHMFVTMVREHAGR